MKLWLSAPVSAVGLLLLPALAASQDSAPPEGIKGEQALPSRYQYVVQDILKLCQPTKGFWVDLGAGEGPVAMHLIEATGNPVLLLDPNRESLTKGLELAREKKIADRVSAVIGSAESLPFPDNTVDLVVSRGSIFFWDDPIKGLHEVHRVLRPGGKAYIGGGAGSGYPKPAVNQLIQERKDKLQGEEAEKWRRFVELRRPEQMRKWAEAAGLGEFEVFGQGALSADDEEVGQGVWLLFEKEPPAGLAPAN